MVKSNKLLVLQVNVHINSNVQNTINVVEKSSELVITWDIDNQTQYSSNKIKP